MYHSRAVAAAPEALVYVDMQVSGVFARKEPVQEHFAEGGNIIFKPRFTHLSKIGRQPLAVAPEILRAENVTLRRVALIDKGKDILRLLLQIIIAKCVDYEIPCVFIGRGLLRPCIYTDLPQLVLIFRVIWLDFDHSSLLTASP